MNKKGLLAVVLLFSAHIVLGMKKAKHINKDTKIILVFKDINVPITQKGLFLSSKFKEIESIFGDTTRYEYFNKDNNEFTIYLDSFMQGSWAKDIELKDIENYAKLSDDKTALKSLSFERLIRLAQLAYFFGATRTEYEEPTKTKSIKKVVVFFPLRDLLREVLECIVTSKITEEDYLNFLKDEGKLCEFVNKIPDDVLNNVACEIFFGNKPIDTIELKHGRWLISSLLSSGNRFALWEKQGVINIWKKNEEGKYKAIQKLNHGSRVNSISSLTDDIFASGGEYGNIKIWKKNKKGKYEEIQKLKHGGSVTSISSLTDDIFASRGKQGVIKILEKNEKGKYKEIQELACPGAADLLPLSDEKFASARGGGLGYIKIFKKNKKGKYEKIQKLVHSWANNLSKLSGNIFASWGRDGDIKIWKKNKKGKYEEIQKLKHGGSVTSISSLTDDIFASGGEYGNIKIWKKNKKGKYEQIQELKHGSSVVYLLPLSGNRFASWGKQGVIKIFEKNEKGKYEQIQELKHGSSVIYLLPLSGNRLASLGKDKNFNIWNYKSYYASFDQAVLINALRLKHAEEKGILNKRNISIIKKNILDELSDAARKIFEKIPSRKISQMRRFGWIKISDEDFKWIENKQRSEKEERNFLGKIKKLQKEIAQVPAKSKDGVIKLYKKMVALKSKMRTQEGKEKVTQIINDVRKERMDVFAEYLFRKFIKKIENGKGSQDDLLSAENLLKAIIKLKKDDKKMAQKIEMLQKRYNEAEKKIIKQEELEGVE